MMLALIILLLIPVSFGQKAFDIETLVLLPQSGNEPSTAEACKAAVQVVIDEINKRTDLLVDYVIKPTFGDETGPAGHRMPLIVNQFRRNNASHFQSPIIIGGWYSPGCIALGSHLHLLDMVQVTMGCSSPALTARRRRFPNTFRMRGSGDLTAFPFLRFIADVGRWKRFGIITNAGNSFDYTLAISLLNNAQRNGFEISLFDSVPEASDHAMEALAESDTRVIVVMSSVTPFVLRFMCQAYKFGITGDRYVFLVLQSSYVEPNSLKDFFLPNCTRNNIFDQFQSSFWIGFSANTFNKSSFSSLGMTFQQFEDRLLNLTGRSPPPVDFDGRSLCHDAALSVVLSLDLTERRLASMNMSLRDYATNPTLVARIANETVAGNTFEGFRIGTIRYSSRTEMDEETYVALQWTRSAGLRPLLTFRQVPFTSALNLSNYFVAQVYDTPTWSSSTGQQPRDMYLVTSEKREISKPLFWSITALAILLSPGQGYFLKQSNQSANFLSIFPFLQLFMMAGCFILNAASVAALLASECYLKRIFPAIGLALFQSSIFARLLFHYRIKSAFSVLNGTRQNENTLTNSSSCTTSNSRQANKKKAIKFEDMKNNLRESFKKSLAKAVKVYILVGNAVSVIASVVYMTVWLVLSNPSDCVIVSSKYDVNSDTLKMVKYSYCHSDDDFLWLIVLACIHVVMLSVSNILSSRLRGEKFQQYLFADLNAVRLASTNLATLVVGAILMTAVLSSHHLEQMTCISVFCLLASISVSATVAWPTMRSQFRGARGPNIPSITPNRGESSL